MKARIITICFRKDCDSCIASIWSYSYHLDGLGLCGFGLNPLLVEVSRLKFVAVLADCYGNALQDVIDKTGLSPDSLLWDCFVNIDQILADGEVFWAKKIEKECDRSSISFT